MIPTASAQYVGAYNVYDDGQIVGATAKCSCGIGHYGYETRYFIDCCPHCGGNLYFEQGAYSGQAYTSPELEENKKVSNGVKDYGPVQIVIWISVVNVERNI